MKANANITGMLNPAKWLDNHGNYLYSFALVRVRNTAVAEDLLQETLLAAIGASERHEGRSSERTWLKGIMKHKVFDYLRRVSRTPEFPPAEKDDQHELDCFEVSGVWPGHWREDLAPLSWPADVGRLLESREFCEAFDRCLQGLPKKMAIAFTLREIDGLATDEICEILDLSPNNLWVILHCARMRLRQLLEVQWFRDGHNPTSSPNGAAESSVPAKLFYRSVSV
jgi:RNA polymerase sigma-70 factor (ECF subfamily)